METSQEVKLYSDPVQTALRGLLDCFEPSENGQINKRWAKLKQNNNGDRNDRFIASLIPENLAIKKCNKLVRTINSLVNGGVHDIGALCDVDLDKLRPRVEGFGPGQLKIAKHLQNIARAIESRK